jgi:subtilisin family serine protease
MNDCIIHRLAAAAALAVASHAGAGLGIDTRFDDQIIVHIAPESTLDAFITAFESDHPGFSLDLMDEVPGRSIHLLHLTVPPECDPVCLDGIEESLKVDYGAYLVSGAESHAVDFVYTNEGPEGKTGSTWLSGVSEDDFTIQYAVPVLGISGAQTLSTGRGTVVAVVDTGIDATHPTLAGRVLEGFNFIDGNTDTRDIGDGIDEDGDGSTDELVGHGTYVAGLISLVAPDALLLPVRVLNSDGAGNEWDLTRGIYYAIDQGVEVINVSIGSTYDTVSVKQAVMDAAQRGIVVAIAAGNFNRDDPREFGAMDDLDPEDPILPRLEIPGSIGVAATDRDDVKAEFSNFHKDLFISAPGDIGTGPLDPDRAIVSTVPGGSYGAWEGTSFATAFVSGAAALLRSQHPEWPADLTTYTIVHSTLATTSAWIYDENPEFLKELSLGAGRLDIDAAVRLDPVVAPPLGDINGDGSVDTADLILLLADWGLTHTSADLNGDGTVDTGDLIVLLGAWG